MTTSKQDLAPARAVDRGTKSSLIGILVNLGLALTKCIAGLIGHSFALVADGLESAADVISGVVVLFGLKLSVKPPDADHPYGHGKAEPIAAIVVGGSLLGAAGTIIYESLHQIRTPHPLPKPYTLVVLAGALIVKELMFRCFDMWGKSEIQSQALRSGVMLGTTEATRLLRPLRFAAFPSLWWEDRAGKPQMIGLHCAPGWSLFTTR